MHNSSTHTKTDPRPHAIAYEHAGLLWLAEAEATGGAPVVTVLDYEPANYPLPARLVEKKLESTRPTQQLATRFGQQLARTHAAGADWMGAPPSANKHKWDGDGFMGGTRLPLRHAAPADWESFYAEDRIMPYLPQARDNGSIGRNDVPVLERLCERLVDHKVESPLPERFEREGIAAARLHGDLWCGNIMWAPHATLIDPAAHGGHPESDLAQLAVFGQPFLDEIYAGYCTVTQLVPGWQQRVGLHQLHIMIVHAALYGSSYGEQTVTIARQYAG